MERERQGTTLREKVLDGVIYERIDFKKAIVRVYDGRLFDGEREIARDDLKRVGAKHEGDTFKIHVREYMLDNQTKQEIYLTR